MAEQFKPKGFFDEKLLVPEVEQLQMQVDILTDLIDHELFVEQTEHIWHEYGERYSKQLQKRHFEIKEGRTIEDDE